MGLVTYDTTQVSGTAVGIRPLQYPSEYSTNSFASESNVMGTTSTTLSSSPTVHSLTMTNGITVNLNGNTLNLDSGAIVSGTTTGGSANTISGGTITFGTNSTTTPLATTWSTGSVTTTEGFIHTLSDLTISSTINDANYGSGILTAVVKDGPGNLTITGSQNYQGGLYLNAGKLTFGGQHGVFQRQLPDHQRRDVDQRYKRAS